MNNRLNPKVILLLPLLLIGLFTVAQVFDVPDKLFKINPPGDYEKMWAKVDSLEDDGLTESANKVVDQIAQLALSENNEIQLLKAFMFSSKYRDILEEESFINNLENLNLMIGKASSPMKQLLYSVKGEVLWNYYLNNMWSINQRTPISNDTEPNIEVWDAKRFALEAMKCYEYSLIEPALLQKTSLNGYEELLQGDDGYRFIRPTLFDFLTYRAISFYQSSYLDMLEPAEKFEIDREDFFLPGAMFSEVMFDAKDSLSSLVKAVKLFQSLYKFHSWDGDRMPYVQLELLRLDFVHNKSVLDDKGRLYLNALTILASEYKGKEEEAEVNYVMARAYYSQSSLWQPNDDDEEGYRNYRKKAVEICDRTMADFSETDAAHNCKLLKREILAQNISVDLPKANSSKQNILVGFSYRNLNKLYIKVYKHNYDVFLKDEYKAKNQQEKYKIAKGGKLTREYSYDLKSFDDHFDHTTEVAMEPFEYGFYTITFASSDDDTNSKTYKGYASFWSTDIGMVDISSYYQGGKQFSLFNRETGKVISRAQVSVFKMKYNYAKYIYEPIKIKTMTSDKQGRVKLSLSNDTYFMDIRSGKDRFVTDQFYVYNYNDYNEPSEQVRFFLDRGLYRPGQNIHFKLIAVKNDLEKYTILPKKKIKVYLYDINSKEVSSMEVVTNDFGTASGTFTIPRSVAAGSWYISCSLGNAYFQVEEYKRPKFEVSIDSIPGSYEINDVINVRGSANALAKFGISDAKVVYKVERTTQMWIYDWSFYNRYSNTTKTIATGEMKTDEKGEFEFSFQAIPDLRVKRKYDPYFSYKVTADVTDLSGETRSASFSIIVGYKSMTIGTGLPYYLNQTDTNKYEFFANNLSGFAVNTKGSYEIKKVKVPDNYMTSRQRTKPDEPLLSKEEFKKKFPHQPYTDEDPVSKWPLGETVASGVFDTEMKTTITQSTWSQLAPGWYAVEMKARDSKGNEVTSTSNFMVYDKTQKAYPYQQLGMVIPIKTSCVPGEEAEILVGSAAPHGQLHVMVEYDNKIIRTETYNLNKEQKLIKMPSSKDPRKPLILHMFMCSENNTFYTTQYVYSYDESKSMELELVTFRDKLAPGQDEEWKLKLKGGKGENIKDAEILANMYDASLDLLSYNNYWSYSFENYYYGQYYLSYNGFNTKSAGYGYKTETSEYETYRYKTYESLNYFGWNMGYSYYNGYGRYRNYDYYWEGDGEYSGLENGAYFGQVVTDDEISFNEPYGGKDYDGKNEDSRNGRGELDKLSTISTGGLTYTWGFNGQGGELPPTKPRTNFNETAFFMPHLVTDENGEVILKFTVPESLTRWKFRALAITKDLKTAYIEEKVVTQKELMITAFAPRFVREGDKIHFSAKVTNLTDKDLSGTAELKLEDAILLKPLDLVSAKGTVAIDLKGGESKKVSWYIEIPNNLQGLTYTITAKTGRHTDGEEMTIPVLSNRILVKEAVPMNVRGDSSKTFKFTNLLNSTNSKTLEHERLTLEVTSNPAWYAIQALPYMMEYPYECAEQTFNRYYANAIGTHIANSDPRINKVFEVWRNLQPNALLSNLEKNEELKNILIEETPWLRDAKDESERKRRVGILFDMARMSNESDAAINKLAKMQVPNGGWPWFDGGPDSRYITQYIVSGMGHLKHLGVTDSRNKVDKMLKRAVYYLDNQITKDYKNLLKWNACMDCDNISYFQIQYLYARSFFPEFDIKDKDKEAYDYYFNQAEKYWLDKSIYMQGMISLAHHRGDNKDFAKKVIRSIGENAVKSDEMGMYWKQNASWYWYDAQIEKQALLIEAFDEVTEDLKAVEEMKIWLLKNKQTNDWNTTKATADACYALLLRGTDLLAEEPEITIELGNTSISSTDPNIVKEAGTGYFKYTFDKSAIKPEMGNMAITKKGQGISWGAVYWQYFEDIDKVPASLNNLQVVKRIFKQEYTSTGNTLVAVTEDAPLNIGDRLVVRLELKVDRDMEYVHIKDMRASALEPENVISRYKWQEGLSYYESTRDAATNFFIEFMPKGTYVFEYNLRVTHAGDFSNGLTTIQCMYAPEFTSHTPGIRIQVANDE